MAIAKRHMAKKTERQQMLDSIVDAVTASGKKFREINKESFFGFFKSSNIPKDLWESLYADLVEVYEGPLFDKKKEADIKSSIPGSYTVNKSGYTESITKSGDPKKRTPRKSVFGDIVKVK